MYMEATLQCFEYTHYGLYCPMIGLAFILIATSFSLFIKIGSDQDVGHGNSCGSVRGALFIFGGVLYILGYIIHASTIPDDEENYYWWYNDDEMDAYPDAEYLIGRGLFVGFHAMFLGYLYIMNGRFPQI